MRYSSYLPLALITTSIVLVAPQQVKAISSSEVAQIAKAITVKIDRASSKRYGSGFIIKKEADTYYVLTAYHVVGEVGKYSLTAPDGEQYAIDYKTLKYKQGTDLAIVQFKSSKTYKIAKIGDSDKALEGTISYVAGFWPPTGSFPSPSFRFMEGKITGNATRPVDEGYQILYSNNTVGGVSGGAVLNEKGEVIAIHGRGEQTLDPNSKGELKTVSTGNSTGIAVNTFLRLGLVDVGVKAPAIQVSTESGRLFAAR
jgi:S1-C subfamily serine protease